MAGGRLIATSGDITSFDVDAIVNAANTTLLGGGGVDGAIHAAGGATILKACRELRRTEFPDGLPTGSAVVTTAGNLKADYVIHTVGPVWRGGESGEESSLRSAYVNSLSIASEMHLASVAFPAISTGVYGFPKESAARITYTNIVHYLDDHSYPETVNLVFYSEGDLDLFLDIAREIP